MFCEDCGLWHDPFSDCIMRCPVKCLHVLGLVVSSALPFPQEVRAEAPAPSFVVTDKTPKFSVTNKTCICGDVCKCEEGRCPAGCPVPPALPPAAVRRVQICDGGKCRIVELDPSFVPPGFGRPPAGTVWYKFGDGRYGLYQIPTR